MKEEKKENKVTNLNINDPKAQEEFRNRIKKARNKKKISQEKLGDLLSVTRQAISKWENGKSIPDITSWKKISEVLEIDLSDFVNMIEPSKKDNSIEIQENSKEIITPIENAINKYTKDIKNTNNSVDIKIIVDDKRNDNRNINNNKTNTILESINDSFTIKKKTLFIVIITLLLLLLFFITIFFVHINKRPIPQDEPSKEWEELRFYSNDSEIIFNGYVIHNNDTSVYNFENFFYNSPLAGTKKEPMIKKIVVFLYINNKEAYSYTYEKSLTPLHDFLDNISIALEYKEEYTENSNIVIKFIMTQKNNKEITKEIVAISE